MEKVSCENELGLWEQSRNEIMELTDRLGYPIEGGVLEALVGMKLLGLRTDSSCEGHFDNGRLRHPYIQGKSNDKPLFRFVGEKEIADRFLFEHGLSSFEEIVSNDKLFGEYEELTSDLNEDTEEYKEWMVENNELETRVRELVDGYVRHENEAGRNAAVTLSGAYPAYRIVFGNTDTSDGEQALSLAQEELLRFTEYLKTLV